MNGISGKWKITIEQKECNKGIVVFYDSVKWKTFNYEYLIIPAGIRIIDTFDGVPQTAILKAQKMIERMRGLT